MTDRRPGALPPSTGKPTVVRERTRVGIVGAGPAGLVLARLLDRAGVAAVVVEERSREERLAPCGPGWLDPAAADVVAEAGIAARMYLEGAEIDGLAVVGGAPGARLDLAGQDLIAYPVHDLVRDALEAREAERGVVRFGCEDVRLHGLDTDRPSLVYRWADTTRVLDCIALAVCDGAAGSGRPQLPAEALAEDAVALDGAVLEVAVALGAELPGAVVAAGPDGLALAAPCGAGTAWLVLGVPSGSAVADWPAERIREVAAARLGDVVAIRDVGAARLAPLAAAVREPLPFPRVALVGDAAHALPPLGGSGLALALGDAAALAAGLAALARRQDGSVLAGYGAARLPVARAARGAAVELVRRLAGPADDAATLAALAGVFATPTVADATGGGAG